MTNMSRYTSHGGDTAQTMLEQAKREAQEEAEMKQICACCNKEIKQVFPVHITKDGETLCFRCDRYDIYTEQAPITKHNCYNNYLYAAGKEDFLYPKEPVDVRKVRDQMLGFGGSWYRIELFNGDVLYSNNVWCTLNINNVPEKLKDLVHPNIKSIVNVSNKEGLEAMGWLETSVKDVPRPNDGAVDLDDELPF